MSVKVISSGQNYFSVMLSSKQILTKIYFGVSATLQPNPIDIGVGGGGGVLIYIEAGYVCDHNTL